MADFLEGDEGETLTRDIDVQLHRMENNISSQGYSDGFLAGKEKGIQLGFDDGFVHGASLGSVWGALEGKICALVICYPNKRVQLNLLLEELKEGFNEANQHHAKVGPNSGSPVLEGESDDNSSWSDDNSSTPRDVTMTTGRDVTRTTPEDTMTTPEDTMTARDNCCGGRAGGCCSNEETPNGAGCANKDDDKMMGCSDDSQPSGSRDFTSTTRDDSMTTRDVSMTTRAVSRDDVTSQSTPQTIDRFSSASADILSELNALSQARLNNIQCIEAKLNHIINSTCF